jgi:hypothetical protein
MKAVKITKVNQDKLASDYGVMEDKDERLPLDYTLVTEFGQRHHFSVVSPENLIENFEQTSPELSNGYYELKEK